MGKLCNLSPWFTWRCRSGSDAAAGPASTSSPRARLRTSGPAEVMRPVAATDAAGGAAAPAAPPASLRTPESMEGVAATAGSVWGSGFGVRGLGFGVWGLGYGDCLRFGVWGLRFGVRGLGLGPLPAADVGASAVLRLRLGAPAGAPAAGGVVEGPASVWRGPLRDGPASGWLGCGPASYRLASCLHGEREFFIDNLLVRIHSIIEMILEDRACVRVGRELSRKSGSCFPTVRFG